MLHIEDLAVNRITILGALKKLPLRQRVALELNTAGFNQRESGIIMGLTRSAVGIMLKKARNSVERELRTDDV